VSGLDETAGPGEDRVLAGEYVLGVLDADAMAGVRSRARLDPAFQAEISWWEVQLLPLAGIVAPRTPPAALWDRLAAATAAVPLLTDGTPLATANENTPSGPLAGALAGTLTRRRVWPWQLSTAVSLALAAGLAAFVYLQPSTAVVRVAALAPIGARPAAFLAVARADGRMTLASLSPDTVPDGRSLELWVLPPGGTKVAALGLLSSGGETFDLGPPPPTGTQYFVSLEQLGGSQTGQPEGPVLYGGTFAAPP